MIPRIDFNKMFRPLNGGKRPAGFIDMDDAHDSDPPWSVKLFVIMFNNAVYGVADVRVFTRISRTHDALSN